MAAPLERDRALDALDKTLAELPKHEQRARRERVLSAAAARTPRPKLDKKSLLARLGILADQLGLEASKPR